MLADKDLEHRLIKAYFRKFGRNADYPSQEVKYREDYKGKLAFLSNINGTLAVYRIYDDGSFRYLKQLTKDNQYIQDFFAILNI